MSLVILGHSVGSKCTFQVIIFLQKFSPSLKFQIVNLISLSTLYGIPDISGSPLVAPAPSCTPDLLRL